MPEGKAKNRRVNITLNGNGTSALARISQRDGAWVFSLWFQGAALVVSH
jgi:hypothetical protein